MDTVITMVSDIAVKQKPAKLKSNFKLFCRGRLIGYSSKILDIFQLKF